MPLLQPLCSLRPKTSVQTLESSGRPQDLSCCMRGKKCQTSEHDIDPKLFASKRSAIVMAARAFKLQAIDMVSRYVTFERRV